MAPLGLAKEVQQVWCVPGLWGGAQVFGHLPELPLQADMEPVVTSGASEAVPRVLSGDPQNICMFPFRTWYRHNAGPQGGGGDISGLPSSGRE